MSGDQERTQSATPKRLARARAQGDVARSQFAPAALAMILAVLPCLAAGSFSAWWMGALSRCVDLASAAARGSDGPTPLFDALRATGSIPLWSPILASWLASVAAAIGASAATGALGWSLAAAAPKIARLSWSSGLRSIVNAAPMQQTGVALVAAAAIAASAIPAARLTLAGAASTIAFGAQARLAAMAIERFWMWAAVASGTFAGLDVALARSRYAKRLRMTLQETRDERSEQEGKPEIRARRRAIGAKQARRLRIAAIRTAAAVITNPTHVAVALRYEPPGVDVPTVVSTGAGWAAAVVRSIAALHGVPIVESPDLARALHRRVEIDDPIPDEFYAAVAAIFAWILRTRGRLGGTETP